VLSLLPALATLNLSQFVLFYIYLARAYVSTPLFFLPLTNPLHPTKVAESVPLIVLGLADCCSNYFHCFRSRATVIATARAHNHPLITQALFKALSIEQWQEWLAVCQLRPLVSADSLPAETVGLG
jgi:hypothetical protein